MVHGRAPCLRCLLPLLRVVGFSELTGHPREIEFILIEQRVQAHRGVLVRGSIKDAEAETRIEAGLAHGAVALVKIPREPVGADVCVSADRRDGGIASDRHQFFAIGGAGIFGAIDQVIRVHGGMGEQPRNDVLIIGVVVGHLGNGAFAKSK